MYINEYFNYKYIPLGSDEVYIKFTIELPNVGAFSVFVNPHTETAHLQKCYYNKNNSITSFIFGKERKYTLDFFTFKEKCSCYEFDDNSLNLFAIGIYNLPQAFDNFLNDKKSCLKDDLEIKDIKKQIHQIQHEFKKLYLSLNKDKLWKDISIDEINKDDLKEITSKLIKNKEVEHKGIEFRAIKTYKKEYGLQYRNLNYSNINLNKQFPPAPWLRPDDTLEEKTSDNTLEEKTRKCIQMVKIINAENFSNIVNGNLYPIVNTINNNNTNYVVIETKNGETLTLNQSRVKLINVFTEQP